MDKFNIYQYYFMNKIPKYILARISNRLGRNIILMSCSKDVFVVNRLLQCLDKQTISPDLVYLFVNFKIDFKNSNRRLKIINFENEHIWELYSNIKSDIKNNDKISFISDFDEFTENKIESVNKNLIDCDACYFRKEFRPLGYAINAPRYWDFSMTGAYFKKYIKEFYKNNYDNLKITLSDIYLSRIKSDCIIKKVNEIVYVEYGFNWRY